MKLQFKHQKFQADAAKAVCDVFTGQPCLTSTYMIDKGYVKGNEQTRLDDDVRFTGWNNQKLVPELNDNVILENIQKIQRSQQLKPSERLEGKYNLTVEMETGVGKTYTYIKTMYELNKRYGWSKFIVVVPSVAIREGVYKSFQITQDHFAEEYGKKIRYFIYNSAVLTDIDHFASDSAINVMIINTQAFNATGKDARRITMRLDDFRSRRPIDILAKTNPIVVIDEPQSVEGEKTKIKLKDFNPLFTLRYSATPKEYYNLIYRLDAMEAYNKKLVKKIAVTGITANSSTATESYVYLQSINLSKGNPTATIQFDAKAKSGLVKVTKTVNEGYKLYENSGELDEYRNGYTIKHIDGRDDSVEFINGIKIFAGDVIGKVSDEQLRRIQIRETIENTYKNLIDYFKSYKNRPQRTEDISAWVEERFKGRLIFHERAKDLIGRTKTSEVDLALICDALEFLSTEYRGWRIGELTEDERNNLSSEKYGRLFEVITDRSLSIDRYSADYKIKYKLGYNGKLVESALDNHLKVGSDPQNLLRIYFLFDNEDKLIVVGSLPKHLSTMSYK